MNASNAYRDVKCKKQYSLQLNQIEFATVNLNYSNSLATVLPVSYCKNPLNCLTVYEIQFSQIKCQQNI